MLHQAPVSFPEPFSSSHTCLHFLLITIGSSEMEFTICFHHIFMHTLPGTEHGRQIMDNEIPLFHIHLSFYIEFRIIAFHYICIKGCEIENPFHHRVRQMLQLLIPLIDRIFCMGLLKNRK